MKTLKALMVVMIGLSLVLLTSTAFADGKYRHGGPYYGSHHYGKHVYVDRHAYKHHVAPRYARGHYYGDPYRVYDRHVYREYCAPYAPAYTHGYAYRPGWSFGLSFGW